MISAERNALAWLHCHNDLKNSLAAAQPGALLYLLVGAQGSGKSTWATKHRAQEPASIIFDAILVKRSERQPLLAQARQFNVPVVAVWLRTSLEECLARNARRPPDERANEIGLRNVFAALEPPNLGEGFLRVLEVHGDA